MKTKHLLWVGLMMIMLPCAAVWAAEEDTAQMTFIKTALPKTTLHIYRVQKGDTISAIIRKIPDVSEKDVHPYFEMIKALNPDIENLDSIPVGRDLVLPGKPATPEAQKVAAKAPELSAAPDTQAYRVKKGDTLIRIINRELGVVSKHQQTLMAIQGLNPAIQDVNRIYAGQTIRLPEGQTVAKVIVQTVEKPREIEQKIQPAPEASSVRTEDKTQLPQKIEILEQAPDALPPKEAEPPAREHKAVVLTPAARLAAIKHIVTQMGGSMVTSGNYYLPVSKTEQLTIDCAIIPVVELDASTIFLDMGNRSDMQLKKMITDRWSNYSLIRIDGKDDVVTALKKIMKQTKHYEMTKAQKPVSVGRAPALEVALDWLITRKDAPQAAMQGLRFVYDNEPRYPAAVLNHAKRHGLFITEISPEKGLLDKPAEVYSMPPVTVLPTSSARNFAHALLSFLNVAGKKDVDVRVFNIEKDGFNLAIKADVVAEHQGRKFILFSRDLPPQFVTILEKAGNELVFIFDKDDYAKTLETLLRTFSFPNAAGYFTFSGLDKNHPQYVFGFQGVKIKADQDIYVVRAGFSDDMRGLLKEGWQATVVRY